MKITQIRNATQILEYGGVRFLIDPMLCDKGSFHPLSLSPASLDVAKVAISTSLSSCCA